MRLFLIPLLVAGLASILPAQQPILYRVDVAWTPEGERLAPAFLLVAEGKIRSISSRAPRMAGKPIRLEGGIAPALVDAWSGLLPTDFLASGPRSSNTEVAQGLPTSVAGADQNLSSRVAWARRGGIAAAYLPVGAGANLGGLGTAVTFAEVDLPVASGRPSLELHLGSATTSGASMQGASASIGKLLQGADALRTKIEEYPEKVEDFEEKLKEYQEKLDKAREAKEKAEKEKEEGNTEEEGDKKKAKLPKAPKPPTLPRLNPTETWFQEALAGTRQVRFHAESVADVDRILEWVDEYGLDVVLVGGREADLRADALAEADIAVILAVQGISSRPDRSLAERFARLHEAEVQVALSSGGSDDSAQLLLLRAGDLIAQGLEQEAVWAALTSVPAAILGLKASHGQLAVGASADFLHFSGASPFDVSAPLRVHHSADGFDR